MVDGAVQPDAKQLKAPVGVDADRQMATKHPAQRLPRRPSIVLLPSVMHGVVFP
jgi:hypothetical protein